MPGLPCVQELVESYYRIERDAEWLPVLSANPGSFSYGMIWICLNEATNPLNPDPHTIPTCGF